MMASHMRVNIAGWAGRGTIPVGVYAIALSPSGSGKGLSTTLMETEVINTFKEVFLNHTLLEQQSITVNSWLLNVLIVMVQMLKMS